MRRATPLPAGTALPLPDVLDWPLGRARHAPPAVHDAEDLACLRRGGAVVDGAGARWAAARAGETAQQAARRFGVDARALLRANDQTAGGAQLRKGVLAEGFPLLIPEPADRAPSPTHRSPASRRRASAAAVAPPPQPRAIACAACRLLGGSASRCRREHRHAAPPFSDPPRVGDRVRVRWLPEAGDADPDATPGGGRRQQRASWYFATCTAVGDEDDAGQRRVVVAYDDNGGDDEIDWPDNDAALLPVDEPGLARAAVVDDAQKALIGQTFALPGDDTAWKVADVFYSVEEGIDGVVVQYYDSGRFPERPDDARADAFEWAAHDDFEARATVQGDEAADEGARSARRSAARSPRGATGESPPTKRRR